MRAMKMRSNVSDVGRCARLLLSALVLLACVCRAGVQAQTPAATVRLTVTVTNARGEFVMGLGEKDFVVTAGGRAREVAYARPSDQPASVGVLLDASASMGYLSSQLIANGKTVREAVARFVGLGHESNDYFVARIGTRPELVSEWARAERVDLSRVYPDERARATALYDSVFSALEKMKGALNPKRVLVVVSDGLDTTSEHRFEEITRLLREQDVLVYAVGVFSGNDPGTPLQFQNNGASADRGGRDALEEMATATGGKFFFPVNAKEFDAAFDAIAVELRHQYELGVRLGGEDAGAKRPLALKVKVNSPTDRPDFKRLSARTRKAYSVTERK
jgi:Ca-activated chloride channel family protein